MRGSFALLEGLLTSAAFRLNSRNPAVEQSDNLHPRNTIYMSSFGVTQPKGSTVDSTSQPAAISVIQPQSVTIDFSSSKHDHGTKSDQLDVEKSVRSLHFDAISEFIWSPQ